MNKDEIDKLFVQVYGNTPTSEDREIAKKIIDWRYGGGEEPSVSNKLKYYQHYTALVNGIDNLKSFENKDKSLKVIDKIIGSISDDFDRDGEMSMSEKAKALNAVGRHYGNQQQILEVRLNEGEQVKDIEDVKKDVKEIKDSLLKQLKGHVQDDEVAQIIEEYELDED